MKKNIVSQQEIEKIADLAKIDLKDEEKKSVTDQINDVLSYFDSISQVDLGEAVSFDHYNLEENNLAEDEVKAQSAEVVEKIKENFPQREEDQLRVKAVL